MSFVDAAVVLSAACALFFMGLLVWRRLRSARIERLTDVAAKPDVLALDRIERQARDIEARQGIKSDSTVLVAAAEGSALMTLAIPAAALWQVAQIDPNVVSGISQASARGADGLPITGADYGGFLAYVREAGSSLDDPGFLHRLQGYVGEQDAVDLLKASDHDVELAAIANQVGWDALVDGQEVNVKVLADIQSAVEAARANPDITYVLNEDVAGASDLPNIEILEGLDRGEIWERLNESISAGRNLSSGLFVLEAVDVGAPITLVALSVVREIHNYRAGNKTGEEAIVDAALAAAFKGTGFFAGVWIGAKVGLSIGSLVDMGSVGTTAGVPTAVGTVVGTFAGGALGTAAGQRAMTEVRRGPYERSQEELRQALRVYGERCKDEGAVEALSEEIAGPSRRAHKALEVLDSQVTSDAVSWRWRIWPSKEQVLVMAAADYGRRQVVEIDKTTGLLRDRLHRLTSGDAGAEATGLMFANQVALRTRHACEYPELDDVRIAYLRTRRQRAALSHPITKSELARALQRLVRKAVSSEEDQAGASSPSR